MNLLTPGKKKIHPVALCWAPSSHQGASGIFFFFLVPNIPEGSCIPFIFLAPLVPPFRNKRSQVTAVCSPALDQHSARGSIHSDTSVWKVPQQDQCDPFFTEDPRPAAAAPSRHTAGLPGARACRRVHLQECLLNVIWCKFRGDMHFWKFVSSFCECVRVMRVFKFILCMRARVQTCTCVCTVARVRACLHMRVPASVH